MEFSEIPVSADPLNSGDYVQPYPKSKVDCAVAILESTRTFGRIKGNSKNNMRKHIFAQNVRQSNYRRL